MSESRSTPVPASTSSEPDISGRRRARERALELLYEADLKGIPVSEVLESLELEPERFTVGLVTGVERDMATIDAAIDELTPDWPLERMPRLDLALLRIGYCELDRYRNTPVAVIIDEAVELAKQYSTDSSPRFVNGVLGRLAERLRGQ